MVDVDQAEEPGVDRAALEGAIQEIKKVR